MNKKSLIKLSLIATLAMFVFSRASAWGDSPNEPTGVIATDAFGNPDPNGHQKIIDAINDSNTHSIEMWMYSMSDTNIVNALLAAGQRGVNITIIFDGGMFNGKDANESNAVNELQQGDNITILQASPSFSITHAKTFIVNAGQPNAYAWIMSLNTTGNYPDQADFAIKTADPAVLTDLTHLFQLDVINAQNSTGLNPDGQDGRPALTSPNLIVSPVNSLDRIVALINSAQKSIDLTVENLAYDPATAKYPDAFTQIVDALVAKIKTGVAVRVITPECDENWNPGFNMKALNIINQAAGHAVAMMMPYPASTQSPYVHQKLIIIDHSRFFIGSENFSLNSIEKAREIGVVVQLSGPAASIQDLFNTEYSEAVAPVASDDDVPQDCKEFPPPTAADPSSSNGSIF